MTYKKRCQVCGRLRPMTKHHIMKRSVFGQNDNVVLLCRDCHDMIEYIIRKKENEILRKHPELYLCALKDYLQGVRPKAKIYAKKR